jgi:hypothetical protein
MIRRGFWLAVGAAGGIMGYRRAAALGRRTASRSLVRDVIRATRQARGFSRDVREGMDLYMARRPRAIPPTLPASTHGASEHDNDVTAKDDR